MRLFIALDLPAAVRDELAAAQRRLRGQPVRWSAPASMHLTLQFLGETAESLVAPLLAGLEAIAAPAIRLRLEGLGAFPNPARARVIWAGVAGDTAALSELQQRVLTVTEPLGFEPERRPFRAHLTLGRVRQDTRPEQLRTLAAALAATPPPAPLAWEAGRPILFQSTLTPQGAIYRRLGPED